MHDPAPDGGPETPTASPYAAFDHLATMVAIVGTEGQCVFANASFESVLGLSRRNVQRSSVFDWFADPAQLRDTVLAVSRNEYSTSRLEALLRRPAGSPGEPLPVHVIVNQMDQMPHVVVELVEIEQQTRQDREERALDQAQVAGLHRLDQCFEDGRLHVDVSGADEHRITSGAYGGDRGLGRRPPPGDRLHLEVVAHDHARMAQLLTQQA